MAPTVEWGVLGPLRGLAQTLGGVHVFGVDEIPDALHDGGCDRIDARQSFPVQWVRARKSVDGVEGGDR